MRISSVLSKLTAVLSIAAVAAIAATPVKVDGALVGPPIPQFNWRLTGAAMVGHNGKVYIRVDAEGNCHYEYRQECHPLPNGGMVCNQVPVYVCDQTYALFQMPTAIRIADKDVLWNDGSKDLKIGVVKSFLFWKWISLNDGANIQASYDRAALIVDTDRLTGGSGGTGSGKVDRVATFDKLNGQERTLDLVVSFAGTTNKSAKETIQNAGYDGEFAAINTWTGQDPSTSEIGIRVSASDGAALISNLQGNPLVTGIKPYVAAQ